MKQQFDLSLWLQNKSRKVVTRDGREVRIICWDRNTTYWKIVGLVTSPDGSTENPYTYDVNGNESDGCLHDHRNDLFFADEEEVKSPLIKEVEEYFKNTPKEQIEKDWKEIQDWYNQYCTDKFNNEEKLTEFEKMLRYILEYHYSKGGIIMFTKEDYMCLTKERLAELCVEKDKEILERDMQKYTPELNPLEYP